MKIGIDCRLGGLKHAGIGRYIQMLVYNLKNQKQHHFVLFCNDWQQAYELLKIDNQTKLPENFQVVITNINHYSIKEQLILPFVFYKENLNVLHIPHFNAPILYLKKIIITIHDLLWHQKKGGQVTTLPAYQYWIKYFFYRIVTRVSIFKAQKIITPSQVVATLVSKTYPFARNKTVVIYEGKADNLLVIQAQQLGPKYQSSNPEIQGSGQELQESNLKSQQSRQESQQASQKFQKSNQESHILNFESQQSNQESQSDSRNKHGSENMHRDKNRLLYVGSLYPHKNVEIILKALANLIEHKLIIVTARSAFLEKFKSKVERYNLDKRVVFKINIDDAQLLSEYQKATTLIQPSLSEGFGLTGVEAMSLGTPLIASDIEIFKEIYGQACLYFDPHDEKSLIQAINTLSLHQKRLAQSAIQQIKNYDWTKMSLDTLNIYLKNC